MVGLGLASSILPLNPSRAHLLIRPKFTSQAQSMNTSSLRFSPSPFCRRPGIFLCFVMDLVAWWIDGLIDQAVGAMGPTWLMSDVPRRA